MSRARTSNEIWWAVLWDKLHEFFHNCPKLPKKPITESSLPFQIGTNITIKEYNTFLNNYGSSGYKFRFKLNSDKKTGIVDIVDMTTPVHEDIVSLLQDFFKVPNGGVIFRPPIKVTGQPLLWDKLHEFFHNCPKLPKKPITESSLPFQIGTNITIKEYNTFLNNYGSSGYKFRFKLNSDKKTGIVDIVDMTTPVHEDIVSLLQDFFKVPNGGVIFRPPIKVTGQPLHYNPDGSGVEIAPDVAVYPSTAFVPRPAISTILPRPPGDIHGNPHAQIMCEVAVGQGVGRLKQRCLTWMKEQYVRAVVCIKILSPRAGIRERATGYFYRTMTAKLYCQGIHGISKRKWDFGNIKKNSRDPIGDPAPCNAPNLSGFQINIPIGEIFWSPRFPNPAIPPAIGALHLTHFTIDLYKIQQIALEAQM
ncbi:hypothetical protein Glove_492g26 [Diversispora epigaea]|uniref:Uncharacterized protein n=1 Tax=Diversispora epigaea TaxID=1348612 RepID=A0A397GJT9_9GLOM|nr:hypothetical protein Glove_492g26 [Diversispora epigaea]